MIYPISEVLKGGWGRGRLEEVYILEPVQFSTFKEKDRGLW